MEVKDKPIFVVPVVIDAVAGVLCLLKSLVIALTIYVRSRLNPESTSEFTSTSYRTSTKIFTGNYRFSSFISLILDWAKLSGTPSGPSIYFQVGHLNLVGAVGTKILFTLNIEFNVHRVLLPSPLKDGALDPFPL